MSELECVSCGSRFEDSPEGEGIVFDPASRLVPICKECVAKIVRRYVQKWGSVL